jgi:hypothetical protein
MRGALHELSRSYGSLCNLLGYPAGLVSVSLFQPAKNRGRSVWELPDSRPG